MVGPLFGTHLFWGLYHVVHTNPQSWAECPLLAARASSHRDVTGSTAGEVTQWLNIQLAQCLRSLSERERESEMRCMYVHQRFAGAYRTSAQRSERSLAYLGLSQSRFFFSGSSGEMNICTICLNQQTILYKAASARCLYVCAPKGRGRISRLSPAIRALPSIFRVIPKPGVFKRKRRGVTRFLLGGAILAMTSRRARARCLYVGPQRSGAAYL